MALGCRIRSVKERNKQKGFWQLSSIWTSHGAARAKCPFWLEIRLPAPRISRGSPRRCRAPRPLKTQRICAAYPQPGDVVGRPPRRATTSRRSDPSSSRAKATTIGRLSSSEHLQSPPQGVSSDAPRAVVEQHRAQQRQRLRWQEHPWCCQRSRLFPSWPRHPSKLRHPSKPPERPRALPHDGSRDAASPAARVDR